jgi:YHS domain-containing protein
MEEAMSRLTKILLIFTVFVFAFSLSSFGQQPDDEMVKCPVSGEKIKKSEAKGTYEYKGETYYFCCDNCIESFKKDPEKYIHLEDQDTQLHAHRDSESHMQKREDDTVVDPVCGMKIKKSEAKATHEYNGKTYYFCMEGCKEKFVENPENYVKENGDKVTCPVMGHEIEKSEAASSLEYNGKTYYFCCTGCKEKFEQDPEKYTKK